MMYQDTFIKMGAVIERKSDGGYVAKFESGEGLYRVIVLESESGKDALLRMVFNMDKKFISNMATAFSLLSSMQGSLIVPRMTLEGHDGKIAIVFEALVPAEMSDEMAEHMFSMFMADSTQLVKKLEIVQKATPKKSHAVLVSDIDRFSNLLLAMVDCQSTPDSLLSSMIEALHDEAGSRTLQ